MRPTISIALAALSGSAFAWVKDIDINNPPMKADAGSWGYNQCGTKASPDSKCQNIYLRSAEDFCIFGPHDLSGVSETEREAVSYCTQEGHGTRLIPPGTFQSVHFVHTKHYVQITGRGNFTNINVLAGDDGGELDAAGYDSRGNPIGGIVFGQNNQFEHWTEFLLPDEFCIRACFKGPDDWRYCNHIYDVMACRWNIPGNYNPGFDDCEGDDVPHPMGEYPQPDGKIKVWKQGEKPIPPPGAPGKLKSCRPASSPGSLYNSSAPSVNATTGGQNSTSSEQNSTVMRDTTTMVPGKNSTVSGPNSNVSTVPDTGSSYPTEGSESQNMTSSQSNKSSNSETGAGDNSGYNRGTVSSLVRTGVVSVAPGSTQGNSPQSLESGPDANGVDEPEKEDGGENEPPCET